jgi:hypothetical protein
MKKIALLVGLLVVCVGLANAGSVSLQFNGPQGNNLGGEYTYPYQFSINSDGNTYNLMCDSFDHHISDGEQWTANALLVTNLNASNVSGLRYPNAGVTGYLEAAYLFNEAVTAYKNGNSLAASELNWAVWDMMMKVDLSQSALSPSNEAAVQAFIAGAIAAGPGLKPGQFVGDVIYTPTDLSTDGPQEFFGSNALVVSEPTSLSVLGSGLFAFGMLIRRKLEVS